MALTLTPRAVSLIVAAALGAGSMSASLTQNPPPAQTSRAARAPRSMPTVIPQAERLHERLKTPPLPAPGRNPFVYGTHAPRPSSPAAGQRDEADVQRSAPVQLEPPAPMFKLSGVASNMENGATVLTAIVIDNGSMVFVKTGDKLSNGYSVVRVDELSMTLVDAAGVTQTIRLP